MLATKLAAILGEIATVEKRGRNAHFGYDFITESDLVHAVRDKLSANKIFVFTSNESQDASIEVGDPDKPEKRARLTRVTLKHTFVDGDTGESFSVFSQGQGADRSDKGVYKATTGAMKYFIYKCFMIPTGDDPETGDGDKDAGQGKRETPSPHSSPARSSTPSAGAEVPRDEEVSKIRQMEPDFIGNRWQRVKVHFGKHKGKELAQLSTGELGAFIEKWQPEKFRGEWNDDDLALRAALNVANVDWK